MFRKRVRREGGINQNLDLERERKEFRDIFKGFEGSGLMRLGKSHT